ncbi:hypothetical protein AU195_17355 [Mycobacterium sp. IS-1496]|nr:hypothetical protein AU195_17355 [Mycobacterium sp. IS-1496]
MLLASIAMVGAGAIAVTPVAPNVSEIQQRAFELTANARVTDSPAAVYGNLFENGFENLTALAGALTANPFPILGQLAENQAGYLGQISEGFLGVPEAFENFWNGANGSVLLDEARAALERGEFAEAYDRLNRFNVYSLTILSPIAEWLFSAEPSPRLPEGRIGIPEQIAQNFTDVVATIFDQGGVVNGTTKSFLGPFIGVNFEIALAAEALVAAVQDGDAAGAVNVLVNTPGTVFNALFNGYVNPACGDDCAASQYFPGLINGTGPIVDLFVRLPNAIADALKPNTVTAPSAQQTRTADVSATALVSDSETVVVDVEETSLGEKASAEPAAIEASVPLKDAEVPVTVTEEIVGAAPVVVDEAAADTAVEKKAPAQDLRTAIAGHQAAASKKVRDAIGTLTGGRHASNKEAAEAKSDSAPKHAKDDDGAKDAKSETKSESKDSAKSGAASE